MQQATDSVTRTANHSEPIYDVDQALERLGGDRALLREIALIYFEDSPGMTRRIIEGAQSGDLHAVHKAAHALKGLAATFEATELVGVCRDAELAASEGQLDAVRTAAAELEPAVRRLDAALRPLV